MFTQPDVRISSNEIPIKCLFQTGFHEITNIYLEMSSNNDIILKPTNVRWFYKNKESNKWVPFNGYDSINIELNYLRIRKLSRATDEEMSFKELGKYFKPLLVRDGLFEVNMFTKTCYPVYWENGVTEILRGTWFKDPGGPQCVPIDDETMTEKLELTHLALLKRLKGTESGQDPNSSGGNVDEDGSGEVLSAISAIFSNYSKPPCLYTLTFADCHVDWHSLDDVYLYTQTTSLYIRQKLGMQKVGTRLGRGYFEEADFSARPATVSHLCFVVHGMGQKYLKGSIITACDSIRETAKELINSYFPDIRAAEKRVEFVPVEWRNSLHLDGDTVDSITLDNLTHLRTYLNCTFMDVMYYTSPLFRYEINQCLLVELNRLYCIFCERHPYFEANGGKVSILSHSLGCVISYDLVTGWIDPVSQSLLHQPSILNNKIRTAQGPGRREERSCSAAEPDVGASPTFSVLLAKLEAAKEVVKCLEVQVEHHQQSCACAPNSSEFEHSLIFASRLENLFCMGSPLAVYLALRGVRPGQTDSPDAVMPRSKGTHIYNVFHPADPVAYRLEPLLLKHYTSVPPLSIYRCTDTSKTPYKTVHALAPHGTVTSQKSAPADLCDTDGSSSDSVSTTERTYGSSPDSLNFIGNPFHSRLPLSSFMLGFFKVATKPLPSPFSLKRHRPSSKTPEVSSETSEVLFFEPTSPLHDRDIDDRPRSTRRRLPLRRHQQQHQQNTLTSLQLPYRMDYQLKENRYENTYLSALTVHTRYWSNPDLVMFVLMQSYPESAPVDSPLPVP